jgi:tRNA uracil 4-sulfurtransferase
MSASLDSTTVDARADGAVGTAAQELGELCVLLKLGEIVLKGSNRHLFERRLQNNIRAAAKGLPEFRLSQRKGIIMLRMPGASDLEVAQLAERMRNVMWTPSPRSRCRPWPTAPALSRCGPAAGTSVSP